MAATTLVLLALAILLAQQNQKRNEPFMHGKLYPELQSRINDVARIEINDAKKQSTLILKQGQWLIEEQDSYYADVGKIKNLLLELSELEKLEAKTKIAANYAKLGIDDPKTSETARRLLISDVDKQLIAELILGKGHKAGLYLRKADEPQSWLAKGNLSAPADAAWWLDKKLVEMKAEQVTKISITPAKGKAFTLARSKPTDKLTLENLPDGYELKSIDALQSALQNLSFEKVVKAGTSDHAKATRDRIVFTQFDGKSISIESFKVDEKNYITLATFAESQQVSNNTQRFNGWLYQLPAYQYEALHKKLDYFIEPQGK